MNYSRLLRARFCIKVKKPCKKLQGFLFGFDRNLCFKSRIFFLAFDAADLDEFFAFDGVFL